MSYYLTFFFLLFLIEDIPPLSLPKNDDQFSAVNENSNLKEEQYWNKTIESNTFKIYNIYQEYKNPIPNIQIPFFQFRNKPLPSHLIHKYFVTKEESSEVEINIQTPEQENEIDEIEPDLDNLYKIEYLWIIYHQIEQINLLRSNEILENNTYYELINIYTQEDTLDSQNWHKIIELIKVKLMDFEGIMEESGVYAYRNIKDKTLGIADGIEILHKLKNIYVKKLYENYKNESRDPTLLISLYEKLIYQYLEEIQGIENTREDLYNLSTWIINNSRQGNSRGILCLEEVRMVVNKLSYLLYIPYLTKPQFEGLISNITHSSHRHLPFYRIGKEELMQVLNITLNRGIKQNKQKIREIHRLYAKVLPLVWRGGVIYWEFEEVGWLKDKDIEFITQRIKTFEYVLNGDVSLTEEITEVYRRRDTEGKGIDLEQMTDQANILYKVSFKFTNIEYYHISHVHALSDVDNNAYLNLDEFGLAFSQLIIFALEIYREQRNMLILELK